MRYRDDVPLDDRDFAAIRANVRERIATKRAGGWRWAVAFAAIVVVVAVLWPRPQAPVVTVAHHPIPQVPRYAPHVSAVAAAPQIALVRKPRHSKHHRRPKAVIAAAQPMVIHLQTSNPDVRIIWIGGHS